MKETNIKAKTIAVLPFINISDNVENEYFSDGITEEIINALAKIEQLKVISRTSSFYFKNHKAPISEIGKKLNVSIVLEGSVRIHGDILRITAQLINVEDESHFWSETWDRKMENTFEIQDEISLLIADKLRENLGHMEILDHLVEIPTKNLGAYEHYLKGRYHFYKWNPEDANIAIGLFEKALELDNELIEAHLGLADSYSFLAVAGFAPREEAWMKAIDSIKIAKTLDPNNAGLNYLLANQAFFTDADYSAAMKYGQKSIASKPNYAEAQQFMSFLFGLRGDMKKSYVHLLYAKSIDPLNQETKFYEAYYHYRSGNYTNASSILNELLEENPKNLPALMVAIYIKIKENLFDTAKETINNIPDELIAPDERLGLLCLTEVMSGNPNPSRIAELEKNAEEVNAHIAHSYLFWVYSASGKNDAAFDVLDKLFDIKSSVLLLGFSDPLAVNISNDPRYKIYHKRIYSAKDTTEKQKQTSASVLDDEKAKSFVKKLNDFINSEKPYLNPFLTLRLLADQIEIHPNQLSWLLNEYIGKNFNEFINHQRIEYFKKIAVDPSYNHISLIGLAFESGFNSKTVFNTAFKKEVGLTPGEYKKKHSS